MNKEQEGLIELVGQKYTKWFYANAVPSVSGKPILNGEGILTRGEFINKIKTDPEFSETWGLKIEERELSHDERFRIAYKNLELRKKLEAQSKMLHYPDGHNKVMDDANIPTKLITITYNDKTIESYE
jgi:hypothetical protein